MPDASDDAFQCTSICVQVTPTSVTPVGTLGGNVSVHAGVVAPLPEVSAETLFALSRANT
jgi:hypothetical protein